MAAARVKSAGVGRIARNVFWNGIDRENNLIVASQVPNLILLVQASPLVKRAEIVLAVTLVHIGPASLGRHHSDRAERDVITRAEGGPRQRGRGRDGPHIDVHAEVLR